MNSDAGFNQRVGGNYEVAVRDDATIKAQALELIAELGELGLKANDDIALNGLRVLLNVPNEEDLIDKETALASLAEFLKRPFAPKGEPRRLPKDQPKPRENWDSSSNVTK